MKIAVVLGTSKSDGNTRKLVEVFQASTDTTLFDLSDYAISFYDYEHVNRNDDFIHLINKLVEFDHLVFASPVYWYSMSAQLKVFFDRLSDLLTIEKELGRCLKGKSVSVISTGFNKACPSCFSEPFQLTADYLGLVYKGCTYVSVQSEDDLSKLKETTRQALEIVT
ncbi:flavodoxin family protein [Vibrio cholerae]|uniref:flavodoxin family protein n=2 Tax=Vibrio cholerae TaxID=666 RepID=UPI000E0C8745|nr:NAD(P)H-dependent oxidoreductase [Vibrio cholerae]